MEQVVLGGKEYYLVKNLRENEELRKSYNELTKKVYGFDFEGWYQKGYWKDNYQPYTLVAENKAVANVSLNRMEFTVFGETKHFLQIGTVMTDPCYRGMGLSRFLIEKILLEENGKWDMIYLFANDEVLNYYPKFGFRAYYEYQYEKDIVNHNPIIWAERLNMNLLKNVNFVQEQIRSAKPVSELTMMNHTELVMFYCISSQKENIYYIHELQAVTIAEYHEDTLYLMDVYAQGEVNLEEVIDAMTNYKIHKVILGFTPKHAAEFNVVVRKEENTTLFIKNDASKLFLNHKLMFPVMSHA